MIWIVPSSVKVSTCNNPPKALVVCVDVLDGPLTAAGPDPMAGPVPFATIRECLEGDPLLRVAVRNNEYLLGVEEGGRNKLVSRIVAVIKVGGHVSFATTLPLVQLSYKVLLAQCNPQMLLIPCR
jgi:hypothetical protein